MSILEKPIYDLLQSEPFYGNFLLGARIILDDSTVPTAGAAVVKGEIRFYINTGFFTKQTREHQAGILKHEILHVLLDHCGNRGKQYGDLNKKIKNVAMDCAINQHIASLPNDCVTLKSVEQLCKRSLSPTESWEYYYEAIKQRCESTGQVQEVNHDAMEAGDEVTEAEAAINRAAIKDATGKAVSASAGKIPNGLEGIIGALNQAARLPWKQILRNFVANARHTTTKPTRMRPNRRFDLDQPGKKKDRKLILAVCTDSSGSVSDESYAAFMTEIATIAKSTTVAYLIHADCEVQRVDTIRGGKAKGDTLKKRHGNGGTAYNPAIEEAKKRGADAILYFGDFDCADKPQDPGVPFLWVGVGDQPAPAPFGRVLRLT